MPFEPAAERLKRIFVMVPWIHANPGVQVDELCERFAVDRDTLMADFDAIQCSGIPPFSPYDMIEVWVDEGGVTLRMADHVSQPPRLTVAEARDLVIRARAVAGLPGLGEASALRSAIDKLTQVIGEPGEQVEVDLDVPGSENVAALRAAISEGSRLHLSYYSHGRGEMTEREIDPTVVLYANGAWYVVARDVAADEERTFRLDRIKEMRPTGEKFERTEDAPESFSRGVIVTPGDDDFEVTIDLSPNALWITDSVPHERQTKRPDGTLRIHLRTAHLAWLVRLLLSAGSDAKAVAPKELLAAMDEAARAALAAYGEVAPTR